MLAWLIRIDALDSAGAARVLLLASHDDPRLCHLGGERWDPALVELPDFALDFFGGAFSGQVTSPGMGFSCATSGLAAFATDPAARARFARARCRIWGGDLSSTATVDLGPLKLWFDGRIAEEPSIDEAQRVARFAADVDDGWADKPLLPLFAGTGGIEGPQQLQGQPKPLCLGNVRFARGVLIDNVDNVWMVSHGPVEGISAAYDRLASLGPSSGNHADLAALLAASIPNGSWATCLAQGLVRLGAPPDGRVSFDVQGSNAGAGGYVRRAGAMMRRIADLAGGTVNSASLAALDGARPYNQYLQLTEQTTAREEIGRLADSVAAVAGVSLTGELFAQALGISSGGEILNGDGTSAAAIASVEELPKAAPAWRIATEAQPTFEVHSIGEIAFQYRWQGEWSATRVYRRDDVVTGPDGASWLYINATPSAGQPLPVWPDADTEYWQNFSPPPYDGALADVEPGATRTQTANANRVPFSRMERDLGWSQVFNPAGITTTFGYGQVGAFRLAILAGTATAAGQTIALGQPQNAFRATPGERLSAQARVDFQGVGAGSWELAVEFFSADFSEVTGVSIASGSAPVLLTALQQAFIEVPANRVFGRIVVYGNSGAAGAMQLVLSEPMVTSALPGQSFHPPFTPGPNAVNGADVTGESTAAAIDNQSAWATFSGESPTAVLASIATAQADAQIALTALNNIAADGVFDITEKQQVRQLRNDIVIEFPVWRDRANALQVASGTVTAYQNAYDALIAFLNSVAIDSNVNTAMDRAVFTARFNDYFSTRAAIFDAITNRASQVATTLPLGNANRVPFSRMEDDKGWSHPDNGTPNPTTFGYGQVGQFRIAVVGATAGGGGEPINIVQPQNAFRVTPGERLSAQARVDFQGVGAGTWELALEFWNADFTAVTASVVASGSAPSYLNTLRQAFLTVPADRVFGRWVLFGNSGGAGAMQLVISEPMVTSAATEQTTHPPFTPGPNAFNGADVTINQPVVGLLNPATGRATSRRITSQLIAGGVLQTLDVNPISATTSGGVSTVNIAAHVIFDDAGSTSFSSGSIGGLTPDVFYYVWEANPDFQGGARTYVATTNRNDLTVFGRRYVGFVTTPASGSATGGGGWGGGGGGGGVPGDPNTQQP